MAWREGNCFLAFFHLRSGLELSAEVVHECYRPAYDRIVIRRRGGGIGDGGLKLMTLLLGGVELALGPKSLSPS